MKKAEKVSVTVVERPARKVFIKRGIKAEEYWSYCQEVGCDIWDLLTSVSTPFGEPVCMWLPKEYIKPYTSRYVQGVEVPLDYDGIMPEELEEIELPAAEYLMFTGEPFEEKDFAKAIDTVWLAINKYSPEKLGYKWDDDNPRIQLEPRCLRGYIELLPVKRLTK